MAALSLFDRPGLYYVQPSEESQDGKSLSRLGEPAQLSDAADSAELLRVQRGTSCSLSYSTSKFVVASGFLS